MSVWSDIYNLKQISCVTSKISNREYIGGRIVAERIRRQFPLCYMYLHM